MINLVLEFTYAGSRRIFVVTSEDKTHLTGWDFSRNAFRTFEKSKMSGMKFIMDSVKLFPADTKLEARYKASGLVSTFSTDEVLYVVNLGD